MSKAEDRMRLEISSLKGQLDVYAEEIAHRGKCPECGAAIGTEADAARAQDAEIERTHPRSGGPS